MRKSTSTATNNNSPSDDYRDPNVMTRVVRTILEAGTDAKYTYEQVAEMFGLGPNEDYRIRQAVTSANALLEAQGRTLSPISGRMGWVLGGAKVVYLKSQKYTRRGRNALSKGALLASYVKDSKELTSAMRRAMATIELLNGKAVTLATKGLDVSSIAFARKRVKR